MNLPWRMDIIQDAVLQGRYAAIYDTKGNVITNFISVPWAQFIVKAINSHEELLEAARSARAALNHWGVVGDPSSALLDAAIEKAEAKS